MAQKTNIKNKEEKEPLNLKSKSSMIEEPKKVEESEPIKRRRKALTVSEYQELFDLLKIQFHETSEVLTFYAFGIDYFFGAVGIPNRRAPAVSTQVGNQHGVTARLFAFWNPGLL